MRSRLLVLSMAAFAGCGRPDSTTAPAGATAKVNIPGTRVFITPPPGFKLGTDFTGLQRDDTTAVMIMDLMVGNFYKNAATFSRQELESRGVQVFAYQDTTISGYPAKTLFLQPNPATKSYWLVFGDSTFSTMCTAIYPSNDAQTGRQLKQALLGVRYDKKLRVDPLATAPFVLDSTRTKYRLTLFSGGMYTYSIGGASTPADKQHEAAITVVALPADPAQTPATMAAAAVAQLESHGLVGTSLRAASAVPVNGYDAYEEVVHGSMKGKQALVYELFVSNGQKAVLVQGILPAGSEGELGAVREFARTIKFK
ncbi:MAG: hypothetical protein ACRYFX_23390 [Janthinobacterium lividum]